MKIENLINELKRNIEKEKKAANELNILYKEFSKVKGDEEKKMMAEQDRKSTRLNSSHIPLSRMPSSA